MPEFKSNFLAIGLTATLLSTSAMAADAVDAIPVPPDAPDPVVQSFTWNGVYLGAALGAAAVDISPGFSDDIGVLGGIYAGYNFQFNNFVFAPEVDVDITGIDVDGVNFDYVARLKGRFGYAFDRTLVSAIAGGAYAGTSGAASLDDFGWLAGAGADYAITDNVTVGSEYLYHSFDNFDSSGLDVTAHTLKARVGFKF